MRIEMTYATLKSVHSNLRRWLELESSSNGTCATGQELDPSGALSYPSSKGKTTFQSRFMSTTVHPFARASSRPWSRRPMLESRS